MTACRVLVVEDERNIRLLVAAVLRQKGCEVIEASNGREALDYLRLDQDFDLILTDLKMPEMSGTALMAELDRLYAHIPVVIMSAYTSEDWTRSRRDEPVIALRKPFTHTQLVETVNSALDPGARL